MAQDGGSPFLYAADFHTGRVEMYDQNFTSAGSFTDTTLPAGYAPYNVANIGGKLFVTFAKQDAAKQNPVPGLGNGYVDIFSPAGVLLSRLASNAPLDAPWGIVLAPADFGQFRGDLLVANHGDGEIDAFDPTTSAFIGRFLDSSGQPIVIDGLRGLSFGNGATAGSTNTLYFTAGPGDGAAGLLGSLTPQVLVSGGPQATPAVSTVTIMEAALKASIVNVSAVEGNLFAGVIANFTDDNPFSSAGDFTATIDWGDNSSSAGTVVPGNELGAYIVLASHTYADETGSPVRPQPYNMAVAITEKTGAASVIVDGFASVADASLLPDSAILDTAVAGVPSFVTVEGNPLLNPVVHADPIVLAAFLDTNPAATAADFVANGVAGAALLDWGDGSGGVGQVISTGDTILANGEPAEGFAVVVYPPGFTNYLLFPTHTYLKVGPAQIKIGIADVGGKTTSMVANVEVDDAPLSGVGVDQAGLEGDPLLNAAGGDIVTVATFSDANPFGLATDFKASIDWGDGSNGSGTVYASPDGVAGDFIVVSSHKYTEAGTYEIVVTIDDSGGDVGAARLVLDPTAVISDEILGGATAFPPAILPGAQACQHNPDRDVHRVQPAGWNPAG